MASIEISEMMKALRTERAQTRRELRKLDTVILALRELSRNSAPTRRRKRRGMSAAARRKMAKAQKARWVKWRQARRTKT